METKTYTITLADGTVLSGLRLNGDNYISNEPFDTSIFEDNLSPVVISDGENEVVHENMAFVQTTQMGEEYWLVLRDMSENELRQIKMQSDIEYIAMMSDIEL